MSVKFRAPSGMKIFQALSCGLSLKIAFCVLGLSSAYAEQSSSATARATDAKDYGRIILSFESMPEVETSVAKGVIVLTFNRPITLMPDRIPTELPNWIAAARMDPDKKGLRLALARAARPNLIEIGRAHV